MSTRAMLTALLLVAAAGRPGAAASDLLLFQDVDRSLHIRNLTGAPVSFTGYGILCPINDFDPAAWRSIADWNSDDPAAVSGLLGNQATGFAESAASASLIAEATSIGVATLQPGDTLSLGKPFQTIPGYWTLSTTAYYTVPGSTAQVQMDIARLPEPSTWLLAIFAAVGLLALRRRAC